MSRSCYHALRMSVIGCLAAFFSAFAPEAHGQRPGIAALETPLPHAELDDRDDDETRMLKERYNAAVDEWKSLVQLVQIGTLTSADAQLVDCMRRVVAAGLELRRSGDERLKLLEAYVKIATAVDDATKAGHANGRIGLAEVHRARFQRLDAELALLRERKKTS